MSKSNRLLYGVGTHRPPSFRRLPDCLRLLPLHVGHLVAAEVHITVERVIKLKLGLERDESELMENGGIYNGLKIELNFKKIKKWDIGSIIGSSPRNGGPLQADAEPILPSDEACNRRKGGDNGGWRWPPSPQWEALRGVRGAARKGMP